MTISARVLDRADFSEVDQEALDRLNEAVYPPDQFADHPGRAREWAPAQWSTLVTDGEILVSHVGVLERRATVDGSPRTIGGIGGVKTHPAHRGKGYASIGIGRSLDFLLGRSVDFALLVCAPDLVAYYEGLGWKAFEGTLINSQFGKAETFTFNEVLVGDLAEKAPLRGTVDLLGPAW